MFKKLAIILPTLLYLTVPFFLLGVSDASQDIAAGRYLSEASVNFIGTTANALLLIAFFIYQLLKDKTISTDRKQFWLAGFLLLGFVFIPFYILTSTTLGLNEEEYGRHPSTFKEDLKYRVRTLGQSLRANLTTVVVITFPTIFLIVFFTITAEPNPKPNDIIDHFQDSGLVIGQTQELKQGEISYLPRHPDRNIRFLLPPSDLEGIGLIFYYEDDIFLFLEAAVKRLQETAEYPPEGQVSTLFVEGKLILYLTILADQDTLDQYQTAFEKATR